MAQESQPILFEAIFDITQVNEHGKKFDLVNRLTCQNDTFGMQLVLGEFNN